MIDARLITPFKIAQLAATLASNRLPNDQPLSWCDLFDTAYNLIQSADNFLREKRAVIQAAHHLREEQKQENFEQIIERIKAKKMPPVAPSKKKAHPPKKRKR